MVHKTQQSFGLIRVLICSGIVSLSAGCDATRSPPSGPPDARPGSCWDKTVSPAVIETITDQVLVTPAKIGADGSIAKPPVYRTETRREVITPRKDAWFEIPCAATLTHEFVSSLQRALAARGFYKGPISGRMDVMTRSAVRAYQAPTGPDTDVLSLASARALGLVTVAPGL
ncbi:MAG: peptidoglycan-binding domain-containing protein [Sulfitobacter sp.]